MASQQSFFTIITPSARTDTSPLAVGQIVLYTFNVSTVVNGVVSVSTAHTFVPPATEPDGSSLQIPFASLTPPLVAVGGMSYSATVDDTDAEGNVSSNTNPLTWTQALAPPNPPTGFSVA